LLDQLITDVEDPAIEGFLPAGVIDGDQTRATPRHIAIDLSISAASSGSATPLNGRLTRISRFSRWSWWIHASILAWDETHKGMVVKRAS
jgi:hypothetical protein